MTFSLLLLASYLLGAVPVGVLVARARGVDILKVGSGNIGATNVGRVLGTKAGIAVWALDVLKALVPVMVARALLHGRLGPLDLQTGWFLVGGAAILGHCASPFLGFRGGKGISTALGAIVGTAPPVALCCFALFAVLLRVPGYMSFAAMVGVAAVIPFALLFGVTPQLMPVFALLTLFVVYRHRANILRLIDGTEPKFSFSKAGTPLVEGEGTERGEAKEEP